MTWGAVGAAAVGVVGSAVLNKGNKSSNGGAGTTTASKEPWDAAQPWLKNLLQQGSDLSAQYQAQPFSPQQEAAYKNSYAQSDYMRALVPSLLNQMQGQPLGYDVNNPNAKATAWDWNALAGGLGGGGAGGTGGAGGGGSMTAANNQATADAQARAAAAAAAAAAAKRNMWSGDFVNQGAVLNGTNFDDSRGGFGGFRYGDAMPQVGSNAYRDMSEYFNFGGADPNNLYGRNPLNDPNNPYAQGYNYPSAAGGA